MAVPAVTVVVAAAAVRPIARWALHGAPKLDLSPAAWAGIVGQGVLSTLVATAAWQYGSARVGSASAGVFINIEPLMGALIGVLLFGDRLSHHTLGLGGLLILAGSLGVVLAERAARAGPADPQLSLGRRLQVVPGGGQLDAVEQVGLELVVGVDAELGPRRPPRGVPGAHPPVRGLAGDAGFGGVGL